MSKANAEPTLADAKALIARLPPLDRAMLRPWLLAKFDVGGEGQAALEPDQSEPAHRLRRT